MKHATVKLGDMTIPLIGLPESATEQKCECCGGTFHISLVKLTKRGFLCKDCRHEQPCWACGDPADRLTAISTGTHWEEVPLCPACMSLYCEHGSTWIMGYKAGRQTPPDPRG